MKATTNAFHATESFWEDWDWIKAMDAYDFADTSPLAELLRSERAIPANIRLKIAEIVEGERKPNRKAAAKLKVDPQERLEIAAKLSYKLGVVDLYKKGPHVDLEYPGEGHTKKLDYMADESGLEPEEILRFLEQNSKKVIEETAHDAGVSVSTLQNWLRDFRKVVEQYQ